MIQAIIKKGRVLPVEVPAPVVSPGSVYIKVVYSCISAGTEFSSVKTSGMNLAKRAMEQPDNVKKVLNMVHSDGLLKTFSKIRNQLGSGSPTGYSISGIVLSVGEGVTDIQPGDRVAAAGAGIANHAEFVDVPRNLVMRIPENLDFKNASTVTLGGIAMQGVRRAKAELGEFIVVIGAGILGQLVIQMLSASGARVLAIDLDQKRIDIAKENGAEKIFNPQDVDIVKEITNYTNGKGTDAVLYCAATNNSEILSQAFKMTRKKGRVVVIGVWGKELKRSDIYAKEIDFFISTSYGPGRYDENYEKKGLDYPYAYIRWTENRNMEEYLRLLDSGKINLKGLIQASYDIKDVETAFDSLKSEEKPLIVLLSYGHELPDEYSCLIRKTQNLKIENKKNISNDKRIRVGFIGAGGFAKGMHIPNLQKLKKIYKIYAICTRSGANAKSIAEQCGACYSTTDYHDILKDENIDLVMICTRHNLHGPIVLESLQAGKHTFVEKPLCIKQEELDAIKVFYKGKLQPVLMVGFNRRFSIYAREIKKHVTKRTNPLKLYYRMNAGHIPLEHWVHGDEGGGRIVGEACHIIDLFSYIVGSPVKSYSVAGLRPSTDHISQSDNKCLLLEYEDGSVATLDYFSIGSKNIPKEKFEIHFDGKTIEMDDYKKIMGYDISVQSIKRDTPDKGQFEELKELAKTLKKEADNWPISFESMLETTEISLLCQ